MRTSWLVPVRDGEPWLGAALTSALDQCGHEDEVVVVDDGSVRDPGSLLPDDRRVVLLRQGPLGIAAALERGRAVCQGRWIARLDADDRALPGRLDAQLPRLEAEPDLAAIGGRARLFVDEGEVPEGMARYVAWVNGLRDPHPELLVESPLFHPAVTLRASALDAVGGWRSGDLPEDYDLWLRLAAAGWRLANVDQEVVELRDRPDRLTRTDPRYRREAFRRVKQEHLAATVLARSRTVALWGGGRTARPWLRWLRAQGHRVVAVLDIAPGTERQGVPVRPPEALADLDVDLLLVAVGARGARPLIRARIARLRPGWTEGRDWWAVA